MCQVFKVTGGQKDASFGDFTYFFTNKEDALKFFQDLVGRKYPNCKIWIGNKVTHDWDLMI